MTSGSRSIRTTLGILTMEDIVRYTHSIVRPSQDDCSSRVDVFSKLPDEILAMILSPIITPRIYLDHPTCRNILRSPANLRLVCRRFRTLIDELMIKTPLRDIMVTGGIYGDFADMSTVYREYRDSLWMRLSRVSVGEIPFTAVVHFRPCLTMIDSVHWFRNNSMAALSWDDLAPQRAITAHVKVALILSRVIREIINRRNLGDHEVTLALIFHEIDGTWFQGQQYVEERHRHPAFMPFWGSKAMQSILREWRWIFRRPPKNYARNVQVVLPNVAWASNSNSLSEQEAANMCVRDLCQAWSPENDPADVGGQPVNSLGSQTQDRNMICLPGFSSPVDFPEDPLYTKWLGMLPETAEAAEIFCFTIRGLVIGTERDGRTSVLKRTPPLKPIESSQDPVAQAEEIEKARQHLAVRLSRKVEPPWVPPVSTNQ
ncbi:uncharacterized protein Z520_01322 [Fonsecaea multimorphosa CBS 102226]|uniref:F-box domain-containing protein n=1 Tax=Fonsecaea multimorphosa CBS 102226 TaxID=1442371 RepID=A0A0D2J0I4_9EURO|nr:uncharacterized protein Z520_01322 [Fonsecaea multimorphosa CBS 102226]KIY02857.1 hypothetical protein Z520_01322 [Fonsecaea multimorphosa CBS 102226]OAL30695.1 hypothetical protein AYO22_01315 [Fonsecaea multimorphosa]